MATTSLPGIRTEADVRTLTIAFYEKVGLDDLLGPAYRADAQIYWPQPLFTLSALGEQVLLNTGGAGGWPFPGGLVLPNSGAYLLR
jgi:truncated hemoglobin YjbI